MKIKATKIKQTSHLKSIEWHEECLKNHLFHLDRLKIRADELANEIIRSQNEYLFKNAQILEAKKQKKTGFDSEKFMKKEKERYCGKC